MSGILKLDVLIVGGGPAGAVCASRLARNGARVAIIEKSDFKKFRVGETIQPIAGSLLQKVGITEKQVETLGFRCKGIRSTWGSSEVNISASILNPYGKAWRVDRNLFDKTLFEYAGSCGANTFADSQIISAEKRDGRLNFIIQTSERKMVHGCSDFVVEATGRSGASCFAPEALRIWLDKLIGICFLNSQTRMQKSSDTAFVEPTSSGWWYLTFLPSGSPLTIYFTDTDLLPKNRMSKALFIKEQLETTTVIREQCHFVNDCLSQFQWRVIDARSSIRRIACSRHWAAAGDALMSFDPLCGQGITDAIFSGIEIADGLLASSNNTEACPVWIEKAKDRFNKYQKERFRVYSAEKRWEGFPFWTRRSLTP